MLNNVMTKLKAFAKDEKGASAIEYAVMAAVLVVVIAAAVVLLGGADDDSGLKGNFGAITDKITEEVSGTGGTGG